MLFLFRGCFLPLGGLGDVLERLLGIVVGHLWEVFWGMFERCLDSFGEGEVLKTYKKPIKEYINLSKPFKKVLT